MPKPAAYRLDARSYAHVTEVGTRFGDLDPLGHVNNVSIARLFEEGRYRFNREENCKPPIKGFSVVLATIQIDFLREIFHPSPVFVHSAVSKIGTSSFQIEQAAFQDGHAVAICTTTLVCSQGHKPHPLPDAWREGMTGVLVKTDSIPA